MSDPLKPVLLVRADASDQIGTGHVMRCLALAQAWIDAGGSVHFTTAIEMPPIHSRLAADGISTIRQAVEPGSAEDAGQTIALAQQLGAAWLVVDGYPFEAEYQRLIKQAGQRLLFIDDYGQASHYAADFVLNQNSYASESFYPSREPDTCLLLGTRYALLRREFRAQRAWKRDIPREARRILVTLGGSDPNNATTRVIQALRLLERADLEIKVVVGAANRHHESITRAAGEDIQLLSAVTDMPSLMMWADMVVSAAGSTCWELLFFGTPVVVVILADNQAYIANSLEASHVAVNAGWQDQLSPEKLASQIAALLHDQPARQQMSQQGRVLVDGLGAERVVALLRGR